MNVGVNFEVDSSTSENFEIVILSDKNGMYLMTGRKWEWRLTVVDYKSNEPWIILWLVINHIYENRFIVVL